MQLTKFTDYSLRVLMYLSAHQERRCTVREIADGYEISRNHIVKVVNNLAKRGFVETVKGKGGGLCLSKPPEDINLRDVLIELEANLSLVECFDPDTNTCCIVRACGLKDILREAQTAFLDSLGKYTLADIIAKPRLFPTLFQSIKYEEAK